MAMQLLWTSGSGKPLTGEGSICITYDSGSTSENLVFSGENIDFTMKSGSEMIIGKEDTEESFYRFGKDGDIAFSKAGTDKETLLSLKNEKLEVKQRDDRDSETKESVVSSFPTGSFGLISSSLIPDADDSYDLGSSGKEWNDLYVDGTAHIDTINLNGTAISSTATEINKLDGYTGDKDDLIYAKDLKATGVTATEFDRLDGVTSAIQTQLNAKLPLKGGTLTGVIAEALIRCTDRDATPTVAGGNKFEVRYSRATNITMFDNPSAGQEITLIITDSAITFVHNTRTTLLAGARNVTLNSGDTITFISNGSVWYEKCRSDNT